jgi:hypothetical protein
LLAADPDAIEVQTIEKLQLSAQGINVDLTTGEQTPDLCFVPLPADRCYRFRQGDAPASILPAASLATPASSPPVATRRRWALALVAGCSVLLLLVVWRTDPAARPASTAYAGAANHEVLPATQTVTSTTTALADVRARDANTDDPTTLEISATERLVRRIVPTKSELGGVWNPPLDTGTAAWLEESMVNPIMCLPPDDATTLAQIERGMPILLRLASGALRQYETLQVERLGRQQTEVLTQREARLTIIACGTSGNERVVLTALYRPQIDGLPPLPDVDRAQIPRWVTVEHRGTTVEPNDDHLRVTVELHVANESGGMLPLTDLIHQLVIDGEALPAALQLRTAPLAPSEARVVRFTYVASSSAPETHAVWQLIAPDGQRADLLIDLSQP